MTDSASTLTTHRTRAASTVATYWPRITNPQWFAERHAQALARGDIAAAARILASAERHNITIECGKQVAA